MTDFKFLAVQPPVPPEPPKPPEPPSFLPVDNPPPAKPRQRSLYEDLFGADLSPIYASLDAAWANDDTRELATKIVSGESSINSLSTQEKEVLDGIARAVNDYGTAPPVPAALDQRLPVSRDDDDDDDPEGDDQDPSDPETDEDLSSSGGDGVPAELPSHITDAYGWTGRE